jgi:endoglucanase
MKLEKEQTGFLEKLLNTPTPSGMEAKGALLLGRRIKEKTGIAPTIDVHGNLHAVYDCGSDITVMLEGHGDEIGYIVEYIDNNGFIYLQAIGGVTVPLTAAERLVFLTKNGPVNGVVGVRPPHLMSADERKNVAGNNLRTMPCDIGATSKAEALSLVSIGDAAVVDSGWRPLAGTRISARGLDDRVGSFVMCESFIRLVTGEKKPSVNIHYVSSVSEELGLVGGKLVAGAVKPDIAICCDVGFATDSQGDDAKVVGDISLGKGPALAVGPIYHKNLTDHIRQTAEDIGIALQERAVPKGAGNNAWALKLDGGSAVAQIAIPIRYMHSPVEVADLKDISAIIEIVSSSVLSLTPSFPLLPEQP